MIPTLHAETKEGHGMIAVAVSYLGMTHKIYLSIAEAEALRERAAVVIAEAKAIERALHPVKQAPLIAWPPKGIVTI